MHTPSKEPFFRGPRRVCIIGSETGYSGGRTFAMRARNVATHPIRGSCARMSFYLARVLLTARVRGATLRPTATEPQPARVHRRKTKIVDRKRPSTTIVQLCGEFRVLSCAASRVAENDDIGQIFSRAIYVRSPSRHIPLCRNFSRACATPRNQTVCAHLVPRMVRERGRIRSSSCCALPR